MKAKMLAVMAFLSSFFSVLVPSAYAGIGDEVKTTIESAASEANIVYVAVIAALAGYFIVKLIRKAL